MGGAAEAAPVAFEHLLDNSLVLRQTIPFLSVQSVVALLSTSKPLQRALCSEPDVFRRLDLSGLPKITSCSTPIDNGGTNWRQERMDEALTQDEFVSGPLRGVFSRLYKRDLLCHVQTMILDGLGVTAELVHEIMSEDRFNVKILSVRGCASLNQRRLMQVLQTAVRPGRSPDMPRLKALYVFGPIPVGPWAGHGLTASVDAGVTERLGANVGTAWNKKSHQHLKSSLSGADDLWYQSSGKLFRFRNDCEAVEWAETLRMCLGIINFDAVLCRGPRHDDAFVGDALWLAPKIATVALGAGCAKCGSSPEEPARYGVSPMDHLPLVDPPPFYSSTVREAQKPHLVGANSRSYPPLHVRCEDCLRARYCERCHVWWDESCYSELDKGKRVSEVSANRSNSPTRIHLGLCTEKCLVTELFAMEIWG